VVAAVEEEVDTVTVPDRLGADPDLLAVPGAAVVIAAGAVHPQILAHVPELAVTLQPNGIDLPIDRAVPVQRFANFN
jgi:hypothetical protein